MSASPVQASAHCCAAGRGLQAAVRPPTDLAAQDLELQSLVSTSGTKQITDPHTYPVPSPTEVTYSPSQGAKTHSRVQLNRLPKPFLRVSKHSEQGWDTEPLHSCAGINLAGEY